MLYAALLTLNLTVLSPAVAISVHGSVEVDTGTASRAVHRFDAIEEGAKIRTGEDGTVQLRMASGSLVRLGPSTEVALNHLEHGTPAAKRKESIRLVVGRLWAKVTSLMGQESKFDVETTTAVAGVRGTSFMVEASPGRDRFILLHGAIELMRQGMESHRLDKPNAFVDSGAGGFGATGAIDAQDLAALERQLGGSSARMVRHLSDRLRGGGASSGSALREATRRDILGPGQLSDSSLGAAVTGSTGGGGTAILDVTIILDGRTGDTGSPRGGTRTP